MGLMNNLNQCPIIVHSQHPSVQPNTLAMGSTSKRQDPNHVEPPVLEREEFMDAIEQNGSSAEESDIEIVEETDGITSQGDEEAFVHLD